MSKCWNSIYSKSTKQGHTFFYIFSLDNFNLLPPPKTNTHTHKTYKCCATTLIDSSSEYTEWASKAYRRVQKARFLPPDQLGSNALAGRFHILRLGLRINYPANAKPYFHGSRDQGNTGKSENKLNIIKF